jgi:hypothetical protein
MPFGGQAFGSIFWWVTILVLTITRSMNTHLISLCASVNFLGYFLFLYILDSRIPGRALIKCSE